MASIPAYAQQGHGNGKAQGAQAGQQKGGGGKPDKASHGNADRGGPAKMQGAQAHKPNNHGPDKSALKHVNANGNGQGAAMKPNKAQDNSAKHYKADKNGGRYDDDFRDRRDGGLIDRVARFPYASNRGLIDGCPPGLAKKNPPCVPPGLAKQQGYYRSSYYRPSFFGLRGIGDGRYYYGDGYLYRMGGNNLVSAFIPLLGGALGIGKPWPSYYQPVAISPYYVDYYRLGDRRGYRYADNVVYRVDPETAAITSIAALLTGDDFRVGQPMPAGYDVYNVPYSYRTRYYDRPDAYYRYSDGYIYQVDPETRLIAAAIELLI